MMREWPSSTAGCSAQSRCSVPSLAQIGQLEIAWLTLSNWVRTQFESSVAILIRELRNQGRACAGSVGVIGKTILRLVVAIR